ncbi:MAG: glycosyl hydrolase [Oscillospiraceae bacterium]|nr:glycosyl hydrolase [Oscillospiraceae bacterium]
MKAKKQKLAALLALAVTAGAMTAMPTQMASGAVSHLYEFEDGVFNDCEYNEGIAWTVVDEDAEGNPCDMTGWSGDGYAYVDDKDSSVSVTVEVEEAGFYALKINYIQCFGTPHKIQYLNVNGESQGEIKFPFNSGKGWELLDAGYVKLNAGKNTIEIASYWGYTFLDYLVLEPAPTYLTNLQPTARLCNPNASLMTQKVYDYLCSVYGNHIISGQQEYCGSHCYNINAFEQQGLPIDYLMDNEQEFTHIYDTTGKYPAIRGIDFLFYNTTQPYYDNAPERAIQWFNDDGGIPTISFHWNVPTEEGSSTAAFYVESASATYTTFSITNALKEGTWEHEVILADIAVLAEQMQKLEDANVPCIFRPLHEAEGAWFWWGAEGPEPCKEMYIFLWDQLTNQYGLDNIIWEWTSYTYCTSPAWYPGDAYVDLIGYDKYNAVNYQANLSAIASTFYSLVASTEGAKMVAMSENDTIPSLSNLVDSKAAWLYFCPWYGNYITDASLNPVNNLKEIYQSEYCITLDELPDWDTYEIGSDTTETDPPVENGKKGDVDCDGFVKIGDVILLNRFLAEDAEAVVAEQGLANAECDGTAGITSGDAIAILKILAGL